MSRIPRRIRDTVVERAANRCEYCQLSQAGQEATFHIDHIQPVIDGGPTQEENLALACVSCSLRKGALQLATDSITGQIARLFHPRLDEWNEHFRWEGEYLTGLTPTGRITEETLALNRPNIVEIRREQMLRGEHPPEL
jgi:hypothetical protein